MFIDITLLKINEGILECRWGISIMLVYRLSSTRKIGPRSYVWSEKEVVDKAAWEFEEVSFLSGNSMLWWTLLHCMFVYFSISYSIIYKAS